MTPLVWTVVAALPLLALGLKTQRLLVTAALVTLSWVLLTGWSWLLALGIVLTPSIAENAYHDTFYVVSHTGGLSPAAIVTLALPLAVVLLLQGLRALWHPRALLVALLGAHLGVVVANAVPAWLSIARMPRRYVDYPEAFALWNGIASTGAALALLGGGAFLVVASLCLWRRHRRGPAPG